jgi:alpha-tubulin suppressor-like RCC1 family protein
VATTDLPGVTAVAAGADHSLAVRADGSVWAWGDNTYGELGTNSTTSSTSPVHVLGSGGTGTLSGVTAVAAGNSFSLALTSGGNVYAWGYNGDGQLGNNTKTESNVPVEVEGLGGTGVLSGITAIAAEGDTGIALTSSGTVWTWRHRCWW